AIAFQKDLGAAHSLAHTLSTEFNVHHGLANSICLPHVMRFNKKHAAAQYARIAAIFGVGTSGMDGIEAAGHGVDAVAALIQRLKIPMKLRECNIPEEALPKLAKKAFEDSCHKTNPRPCTEADLLNLYREAW
ncbi:iron-containing alcohol dehydrogenase, partial [Candidatus Sumerlaeota bacterium]|nr:iron-containing alcohol dehydrogenase [Candidatus Sumerlaeota bacterium]